MGLLRGAVVSLMVMVMESCPVVLWVGDQFVMLDLGLEELGDVSLIQFSFPVYFGMGFPTCRL